MAGPTGMGKGEGETGRELDLAIARLLTFGTYLSIAFLGVGLAAMMLAGISPLDPAPTLDPAELAADVLALRPEGFLWLGLIAVIATPTARIVAALVGFVRSGEREMVAISIAILGVIALSVILSRLAG